MPARKNNFLRRICLALPFLIVANGYRAGYFAAKLSNGQNLFEVEQRICRKPRARDNNEMLQPQTFKVKNSDVAPRPVALPRRDVVRDAASVINGMIGALYASDDGPSVAADTFLSEEDVGKMIRKAPYLITLCTTTASSSRSRKDKGAGSFLLLSRLKNLKRHVPIRDEMLKVIRMAPKILTFTASSLNDKISELTSVLETTVYKVIPSTPEPPPPPTASLFLVKSPQLLYLHPSTIHKKILSMQLILLHGRIPHAPQSITTVDLYSVNAQVRNALEGTPCLLLRGYGPLSRLAYLRSNESGEGETKDYAARRRRRIRGNYLKSNPEATVQAMLEEEVRNRELIDEGVQRQVREWVRSRAKVKNVNLKRVLLSKGKFSDLYEGYAGEAELKAGVALKAQIDEYFDMFWV